MKHLFVARLAIFLIIVLFGLQGRAAAQGSKTDYERAGTLRERTRSKVLGMRLNPIWAEDGKRLWFRQERVGGGADLVSVDTGTGRKEKAYDHDAVARALFELLHVELGAGDLPIERIDVDADGTISLLLFDSKWKSPVILSVAGSRVRVDTHQSDHPFFLTEESPESNLRSRGGSNHTSILFLNSTDGIVEILWVENGGGRRKYATLAPGKVHRQHTYSGHAWVVVDEDGTDISAFRATPLVATASITGNPESSRKKSATLKKRDRGQDRSPGSRWKMVFRDHNAFLVHRDSGSEHPLTSDGISGLGYGPPVSWSPDGNWVVLTRTKSGDDREVHVVESSPADRLQPRLMSYDYLKPGDQVPISKPCLFHVGRRKEVPLADELFSDPFRIDRIHWKKDSSRFFFVYNQRGHQVLRLLGVAVRGGKVSVVAEEKSPTFVDYANKTFVHHLEGADEVVWMSERDGWNHLYLIDRKTGRIKRPVTQGKWVVRDVSHVKEESREIWFRAGGLHENQDPYYLHAARAKLDRSEMTILTEGNGNHAVQFSPDRNFLVDTWSRVDLPPVHELRNGIDGSLICELVRSDLAALLEAGFSPPLPFTAKGRDGETDIYGVIFRPRDFNPDQSYPVVEAIYAGPHGQHVPKSFRSYHGPQSLAELGFITVQIDGMGTNWRSKEFHDVCWKNLADAGFPDRIVWMKAASKVVPQMDLERVGIYGGSAGGQNAMRALIDHHDFYDVAVADCGCHDNRMDKIWWNELWMGYPVDESYEKSSNVAGASRMEGKLLLTVGELDRNVDPASTMQVVDALIKADKDFDLIVFPGGGHGAGGSSYGTRRRRDFFVRHLLGVEPRWEKP